MDPVKNIPHAGTILDDLDLDYGSEVIREKTLGQEIGIPELEKLYYDIYDFGTGKFNAMSRKARNAYQQDLKTFYKTFTGKNVKGYKYGELFEAALWSSYSWKKNLSSSVKIDYSFRKKMNGSDNEMNPRMNPAMDSYNQGYQKLNIGFGVNLKCIFL